MKKFNKMIAVLMSVAMIVCMFAVPASAASIFDSAIKIDALETVSDNFEKVSEHYYKINLSSSGKITFHCGDYRNRNSNSTWDNISLLDANGNTIIKSDATHYILEKEYTIEKKGVYYIRFENYSGISSYKGWYKNFYYSFKPDNAPYISIAITMKVGDKIDFSTVTSNYKGNITWKTTKSSVATVSKGAVTAKKKGTAQIRAYMDNGDYAEITVKVKK